MNDVVRKDSEGNDRGHFDVASHLLRGDKDNHENSEDSRCFCRDSNREPQEYEFTMLPLGASPIPPRFGFLFRIRDSDTALLHAGR
jgi:hypothetical protein